MFNHFDWLLVIIYCVSFCAVTEIVKRRVTWNPLYLSWFIGGAMFALIHGIWHLALTLESIGIFVGFTFLTNGAYKGNKTLWAFLSSKFGWLPGPDNAK